MENEDGVYEITPKGVKFGIEMGGSDFEWYPSAQRWYDERNEAREYLEMANAVIEVLIDALHMYATEEVHTGELAKEVLAGIIMEEI